MQLGKYTIPDVALDFMNRDHQAFIAHVERLEKLLTATPDAEAIDRELDEMYEHTHVHFAAEENEMQAKEFPPYEIHRQEHQRVLGEMVAQIEVWKTRRDVTKLSQYVNEALPEWLKQHTQSMDFITADWLSKTA